MKTRALFVLMMVSAALHAQQINGSSHLTWNASTGTLTGLAVTSVDGSMGSYYESYVRAQITDENGNLLVINSALDNTGSGEIDITVRAQGSPGHNYFMTSFHHAIEEYTCGGPLPPAPPAGAPAASCPINSYVDYFNFYYGVLPGFWSDFGSAEFPNSWYWIGPGPNSYAPARSLSVAETYSNAELRTPVTCGDLRDQIAQQYAAKGTVWPPAPWLPECTQFNSNQSTGHYTFAQLNYPSPATAPPEFPWA
jgi:hypothetical protein